MAQRKTTFKQRLRKNDLKARHADSVRARKKNGTSKRNSNRDDNVLDGGRSMEELLADVVQGNCAASRDADLDPRALTNQLLALNAETGKTKLRDEIVAGEKGYLGDIAIAEDDEVRAQLLGTDTHINESQNKNKYKHKGGAYVFWQNMPVHELVLKALKDAKFAHPTPVQQEVLPTVVADRTKDLVVSAETGSGKTLVFAIPIIESILAQMKKKGIPMAAPEPAVVVAPLTKKEKATKKDLKKKAAAAKEEDAKDKKKKKRSGGKRGREAVDEDEEAENVEDDDEEDDDDSSSDEDGDDENAAAIKKTYRENILHSLIVSPTRELALQIKAAFELLVKYTTIKVGCIVGGMAQTKQQRILNRCPDVLICTPGRLWELVQLNEGCYLGHSISRRLHTVVLDEADKLLQGGRFEELKSILERIHSDVLPSGIIDGAKNKKDHYGKDREDGEADSDVDEGGEEGEWDPVKLRFIPKKKVASTLVKTSVGERKQKDEPRPMAFPDAPPKNHRVMSIVTSATLSLRTNYTKRDVKNKRQVIRTTNASTMNAVLNELNIRAKNANVFDLSPEEGVVASIDETYLRCPEKSKDLYLYYLLRTYKERTVVFVNAISMLRRLTKILGILGVPVVALHASMQQRQRLKFIDQFKKGDKMVLIATDIASRGLDVEGLKYVIHFQVPRSTDTYIHRCGRTARCGGTGTSIMMVDAEEHSAFKKLLQSLGRSQSSPMELFSLQPTVVHHMHKHVQLALQIDKLQLALDKSDASQRWLSQMSDAVDVDADEMQLDEEQRIENQQKRKAIKILTKRLHGLIQKDTSLKGGKGAFRTGAKAIGEQEATKKQRSRAERQANVRSR